MTRTRKIEVAPARTLARVTTKGKVRGVTTDVTGLLVELWGLPGENRGGFDVIYARCDANGNFAARVLPGSEYTVNVDDNELVSDHWSGVIFPSKRRRRQPDPPELTLCRRDTRRDSRHERTRSSADPESVDSFRNRTTGAWREPRPSVLGKDRRSGVVSRHRSAGIP